MRKQLAMSAGVALAVGAVFIGCSSSSHNSGGFFVPSSVDLNNGDNAPMSSIAQNNLAADNAGFSGSDQNFVALQCKVNKKPSNSDGPATSADGSAVVAFQTADQNDGHFRLYMSYYNGTTFTPPIEVTGQDRDEYASAGGSVPDITTNNILMIPLNTSGYTGTAGATTGDAGAARANSGNWVIVWDATTYTVQPNTLLPNNALQPTIGSSSVTIPLSLNQGQRIQQNLQGAHRALYETLFVKSFHSSPSTFSQILGTNGTTTTTGIPSREYRYGFLVTAVQVTTLKRGQEQGAASIDFGPFPAVTTTVTGTLDPTVAANSTGDFLGLAANTGTNAGVYANVSTRTGVTSATLQAQNPAFLPATALNAGGALVAGSVLIVTPATTGYINPGGPNKGSIKSPAESVQSYGFASDGIAGQANFGGSGAFAFSAGGSNKGSVNGVDNPIAAKIPSGNSLAGHPERVEMPHTFVALAGNNGPSPNGIGQTTNNAILGPFGPSGSLIANPTPGGNPGGASYTIGEDVSFVQLFWTQIISSANSGDTVAAMTPTQDTNDVGVQVGNRLAAFSAGLDLRTMLFAAPSEVTVPTANLTEPQPQPLKAAVSPVADFSTYNQFVFFNFMDASICHVDPGAVHNLMNETQTTDNASVREFNLMLLTYAANDAGNGTSALGAPTRVNVVPTSTMTADKMDLIFTGANPSVLPNNNPGTFGNQAQAWLASAACVVGPDEGLGDTTVFFVERHDSALAVSTDSNVDLELGAAVLTGNGALQAPGKNPVILSSHLGENTDSHNVAAQIDLAVGHPNQQRLQADFQVTAAPLSGTVFQDPVEGVQTCLNRAGTYVVVTYRQWMGTSSTSFSKALNAVVMKTFRVAASNGGGIPPFISASNPPQTDLRFAAGSGNPSGAQPTGGNVTAAIRLDVVGSTGQPISGQPGTPSPTPPTGVTTVSTGQINMLYVPNNPIIDPADVTQPFFPTSTGVNAQTTAPCGYRCGFQSDTALINVLWEQSDTSEDRVYIRQLKVDTTNATPVVSLGPTAEFETGTPVKGDAIINLFFDSIGQPNVGTVVRNSYDFLEGDGNLGAFGLSDLGVDATKKGGGLLVVYGKTTDGTISDGNNFNRDIVAVQWDGTALSNRTVIDRGVFEDSTATNGVNNVNGTSPVTPPVATTNLTGGKNFLIQSGAPLTTNNNGSGESNVPAVQALGGAAVSTPGAASHTLHTVLLTGVAVSANPAIETTPSLSPTATYIYFLTPNGDNANSATGLYTRLFNNTLRTQANSTATFGDQFVPTAGPGLGGGTTATDALQPTRLDHMTGGDVTSLVSTNVAGTTVTLLFWQDAHLWLSGTTDGITYTNDGKGSADPFLVDNDTSANTGFAQVTNYTDSKCNNLHQSILFFGKNDLSQTNPTQSGAVGQTGGTLHTGGFFAFRLRIRTFN
jgi:hypothetical protein